MKSSLTSSGDESDSPPPQPPPLSAPTRRLSKDDSLSSSNSDWQPSGDEYNVYYYDPKALNSNNSALDKSSNDNENKDSKVNYSIQSGRNIPQCFDHFEILVNIVLISNISSTC